MATASQLSSIATDIVVAKVIEDKLQNLEKERGRDAERGPSSSSSGGGGDGVHAGLHAAPETEDATSKGEEEGASESQGLFDDDLTNWRERRLRQLKAKIEKEEKLRRQGNGSYEEIIEEEFLPTVTKAPLAVVHFFSHSFERCKVMHKHLEELAILHRETRFVRLNAEKAPFFCQKLAIRCLPSVVFFRDGIARHTLVGFEELGAVDTFPRKKLEKVMLKHKVILPAVGEQYYSEGDDDDEDDNSNQRHSRHTQKCGTVRLSGAS